MRVGLFLWVGFPVRVGRDPYRAGYPPLGWIVLVGRISPLGWVILVGGSYTSLPGYPVGCELS